VVGPPAGTDEHWRQAGVTFRRRLCSDPATTWEICAPNDATPAAKDIDTDADGVKVWMPTLAWIGDRCTALQWTSEDTAARARDALEMKTSKYVANELWTGASSTAQGLGNDFLANPATVTDLTPVSGTSPLVYALNLLQNALHDQAGRGMIHATSATVNLWISSYVVRREGNVLLDSSYPSWRRRLRRLGP
jgi:hypothetical protein